MILNSYDRMAIKNAAKACSHFLAKKQTLVAKQEELQKQIDELDKTIAEYGEAVVNKTGYQPLELVEKVGSTWVFKYPDTIIPEQASSKSFDTYTAVPDYIIQQQMQHDNIAEIEEEADRVAEYEAEQQKEEEKEEIKKEETFIDPFSNF
jgi:hypothetical protein